MSLVEPGERRRVIGFDVSAHRRSPTQARMRGQITHGVKHFFRCVWLRVCGGQIISTQALRLWVEYSWRWEIKLKNHLRSPIQAKKRRQIARRKKKILATGVRPRVRATPGSDDHRRTRAERRESAGKTEITEHAKNGLGKAFPHVPLCPSFPRSLSGPQEKAHVATRGRELDRRALHLLASAHASAGLFRLR